MWVLALDVGTSSARAVGYDAAARPIAGLEASVPYEPVLTADGGVELDADHLLEAVAGAIDRCVAGAAEPPAAIGASTFWHGLLLLDGAGAPLSPVFTWADTRSAAAARALRARLDEASIHARTGAPLHATFFPAKLTWLRERDPARLARAATICGFAEYLLLRMTGRLASSLSMASGTGLLDQSGAVWDPAMLEAAGVAARQLPPIDDAPVRGLQLPWRRRWPALEDALWLPAAGDGACSNLGSGCIGPDRVALNVGTSAALRLVTEAAPSVPWGLWHYRVDARRHLVGGATSEGGNVWAWARRVLALPEPDGAVEEALAATASDGHGLTALPFLAGERSPGWHEDARGALTGLGLATTAPDMLRALLEAVAYRLGAVYERLAPLASPDHTVVATGGALARSPAWARIVADVLGRPLEISALAEASGRGAALLALEALGAPEPPALPPGRTVAPDGRRHAMYAAAMGRQRHLYDIIVGPRLS
jgi:gluconokinase